MGVAALARPGGDARRVGRKLKPVPVWALALLLLPLVVDGTTHMVSDVAGIGHGFREPRRGTRLVARLGNPPRSNRKENGK